MIGVSQIRGYKIIDELEINMNNDVSIKKIKSLNIFYKLFILYFFIVISIPTLQHNRILYWSSIILIIISLFLLILTSKLRLSKYIYWIFLFDFIVTASGIWSSDFYYASDEIKKVLIISIVCSFISLLIKSEKNFYEILKLFVYSKIVMTIYIFLTIDMSTIGIMRIGAENLGEEWNANYIGINMALSSFMSFVLFKVEKKQFLKIFYIVTIFLFGLITILTGSRKALFLLLFTISMYILLNSTKNKFSKLIIILLSGLTTLYLVMNIPFLYNVLGSRIDSLLANFNGQGKVDSSTLHRLEMIEYGKYLFSQKPILGYGINNFRTLYGSMTGWYTYSHNNYIDLLTGVGLVGTTIYYLGYLYIIRKTIFRNHSLLRIALISILALVIIEVGLVSYSEFFVHLLICLSFSAVLIAKQEEFNNE